MLKLIILIALNLNNLRPMTLTDMAKELSRHLVSIFNVLELW